MKFTTLTLFLLTAVLCSLTSDLCAAKPQPPNFIIIYMDDLGWGQTSVRMMDSEPLSKHSFFETPNVKRLAEMGTRFSNAYSPTPTCTGSRVSIQLGQSSARAQYRFVNDVLHKKQRPEGYAGSWMIVTGPGIPADTQCDTPVAQWDYLTTFHDLAGSAAPLPEDLDGVSLRPVLEQGNAGQLDERDTGFVFHFPAFYTVPITAYRDGDYKLMRHLNTGEIKLFNVVDDMGESKDLSQAMPEKTADMIRKLDAYLEKVGAWKNSNTGWHAAKRRSAKFSRN